MYLYMHFMFFPILIYVSSKWNKFSGVLRATQLGDSQFLSKTDAAEPRSVICGQIYWHFHSQSYIEAAKGWVTWQIMQLGDRCTFVLTTCPGIT